MARRLSNRHHRRSSPLRCLASRLPVVAFHGTLHGAKPERVNPVTDYRIMLDMRFPIGEFELPGELATTDRDEALDALEAAPGQLRAVVADLTEPQLDTAYRPDGWTVRQVVHHLPDSHSNAFIRLKLALTENDPIVRTYDEARWARLPDAAGPIVMSLQLLDALHARWVWLFRALPAATWSRTMRHPDLGPLRIDELLAFYAWHGRHHIAHITSLRTRQGW